MKEIRVCDDGRIDLALDLCKKYGTGIEIQGLYNPYAENKKEIMHEYQQRLLHFQKGKSFHAPFWDLCLGTKIIELQDAMLKIYNEAYDQAKELGCTEMVIHSNYKPGTDWYEGWISRAKSILHRLLENKDHSITICIENQFESDSELLSELIDEVNDSRVRICLDIGHANANSNMSVEEWIKTLKDKLYYYHLHNNHGKQTTIGYNKDDEHLALTNGTIDVENVLQLSETYSPNAIWNIECKTEAIEESLEYLKKIGYIKKLDI